MKKYMERLTNGLFFENPTFVLMLGMCPTLATTTSAINAIGMGLSTLAVLVLSNVIISLLRKVIPDRVRIPAYIVIVATLVTIVQMLLKAYFEAIDQALGIYIPLIVVNCIILGRAEAYASKNSVGLSFFDGLGMGLGFTIGLFLIGSFRELLGNGTIMSLRVTPSSYQPISLFVLAPGAFLVLGFLAALQSKLKKRAMKRKERLGEKIEETGCSCCSGCTGCGPKEEEDKA